MYIILQFLSFDFDETNNSENLKFEMRHKCSNWSSSQTQFCINSTLSFVFVSPCVSLEQKAKKKNCPHLTYIQQSQQSYTHIRIVPLCGNNKLKTDKKIGFNRSISILSKMQFMVEFKRVEIFRPKVCNKRKKTPFYSEASLKLVWTCLVIDINTLTHKYAHIESLNWKSNENWINLGKF